MDMIESTPVGNKVQYSLKNQKFISDLLIKYGSIFLDEEFYSDN
jgi:hypothetical protein